MDGHGVDAHVGSRREWISHSEPLELDAASSDVSDVGNPDMHVALLVFQSINKFFWLKYELLTWLVGVRELSTLTHSFRSWSWLLPRMSRSLTVLVLVKHKPSFCTPISIYIEELSVYIALHASLVCLAACPENRIKDVKMWARVLLQWDFTRTAIQVVTEFCKPWTIFWNTSI